MLLTPLALAFDPNEPRVPAGHPGGGQWTTEPFKKWFEGSKVVDADGRPLVVYHGTSEKFTSFDPERKGARDPGDYGKGFYFTASKANAEMYSEWAKGGGASKKRSRNVMAVYLAIKRPFVMKDDMDEATATAIVEDANANRVRLGKEPLSDLKGHAARLRSNFNSASEVVNKTKERARILSNYISTVGLERIGYDGIIGTNEIVAFRPSQIKSATGNRGTFDPGSDDIRMSFSLAQRSQPAPYIAQAVRMDLDMRKVEEAGVAASQRCLARIRSGFMRSLASGGHYRFSAQAELLNHLVPVMAKTLAFADLMGQRRATLNWREAGLETIALAFDPDQPRDDRGRWSEVGFLSPSATKAQWEAAALPPEKAERVVASVRAGRHDSKNKGVNGGREFIKEPLVPVRLPLSLFDEEYRQFIRESTNPDRVEAYSKIRIHEPVYAMPPRRSATSWHVSDGGHRLMAALRRGDTSINAMVPLSSRESLTGVSLSMFPFDIALDRFSEVQKMIRDAGLGRDMTKVQRGYARRVYKMMRDAGAKIDAVTRGTVANLIATNEPMGRGSAILQATLNKLGVGDYSQSQIETIYATEVARAYHTGRRQMDMRRWNDIWGFRYVTMRDDRVRPTHASWEGTVLKKGNRFWKTHFVPCGWNCRCQIVTIYKTPGYTPREVPPGKINGQVARADDGFTDNWDASLSLSLVTS